MDGNGGVLSSEGIEETLENVTNKVLQAFDEAMIAEIEVLHEKLRKAHAADNPLAVAEMGVAIMHLMALNMLANESIIAACDAAYGTSLDQFEVLMQKIIDGSYDREHTVAITNKNVQRFFARLRDIHESVQSATAIAPGFTMPGGTA